MEIFQEIPIELWTTIFNEILLDNLANNVLIHEFEKLIYTIACIFHYYGKCKIIVDINLLWIIINNRKNILRNNNLCWPTLSSKGIKEAYRSPYFENIITDEINIALDMQHKLLKLQNIKCNLFEIFSNENLIIIDEILDKNKKVAEGCRNGNSIWLKFSIEWVNKSYEYLNNTLKMYLYILNQYIFLIKNDSSSESIKIVYQKIYALSNFQSIIQTGLVGEYSIVHIAGILMYAQSQLNLTYKRFIDNIDKFLEYLKVFQKYYYQTIFT